MKDTTEAVEAMKALMMPKLDAALTELMTSWSNAMAAASEAEIDRCIHIVDMCRTDKRGPAWNEALDFVIDSLKAWKADSAALLTGSVATGEKT